MEELLLTPATLLDLLSNIDEFKNFTIGITETFDGKLQLQVNDSYYEIQPENVVEIDVSQSDMDEVAEANLNTYESLAENNQISLDEPVEGGIIKELLKSLALGGMVRLSAKLLK